MDTSTKKDTRLEEASTQGHVDRRALLAGAAAAVAGVAAGAVARPLPARAADGDPVLIGQSNSGTGVTSLTTSGDTGLLGVSRSATGVGVLGAAGSETGRTAGIRGEAYSPDGMGVFGIAHVQTGTAYGVFGQSDADHGHGLQGLATATTGQTFGLAAQSDSTEGTGVLGIAFASSGRTVGVSGQCVSPDGIGVLALNGSGPGGTALEVRGKAAFSRSGMVAISYPDRSATVTGVPLDGHSLVFATLQNSLGVAVESATPDPATASFQITLSKAPGSKKTPKTAFVAWFVLN